MCMKELVLKPHQYEIIEKIYDKDIKKHILAMDTGTGKTIVGLTLASLYEADKKRSLVICPPILINNAWVGDNEDFFNMKMIPLDKKKIESNLFKRENGIFITSYTMVMLYESYFKSCKWDMIILDESHKICNRTSKTSRTIIGGWNKETKLMESGLKCDRMYLLTGSMVPNNEQQIYQQIKACGYSYSWTKFKQAFFISPRPMMPYIIEFNEMMREQYNKLVSKYSTVVESDDTELSDIKKVFNTIKFNLSKEADDICQAIRKDGIFEINKKQVPIDYNITGIAKLRQVARGFVKDNEGIEHEISNISYKMYEDFIERAEDRPFIVWYCYSYEIEKLEKYTKKIPYWTLRGGLSKSEQDRIISEFKKSKNGVLFIQYSVGKNGLTLTNCRDMLFFSLEDNAESWEQAQARIHRIGQTAEQVNYYIFIARNSIDEIIYNSLVSKTDMIKDLKEYVKWSHK